MTSKETTRSSTRAEHNREEADQLGLTSALDPPGRWNGAQVQSAPLLFSRDGHALYLGDLYRGASAFLIAGGPSFADVDRTVLQRPGCLTMGLNNSAKTHRPDLWVCVDEPPRFLKSIWLDPRITKFVPFCFAEHRIFDNESWEMMDRTVGDCPNVCFYRRNSRFDPDSFLFEDTVNWGDSNQDGGHRSVLLASLRLLFFLGIRNVYLLGVDFKMSEDRKYHFDEARHPKSIEWNNGTYESLIEKFGRLKPVFEAHGFHVHNCNADSALRVFPFLSLDEAVARSTALLPADLAAEKTDGLYERDALERLAPPTVVRPDPHTPPACTGGDGVGVVVGCDRAAEWLLPWWFENYSNHNSFPVTFVDFGMSPAVRSWCSARGTVADLPVDLPRFSHPWFAKPWMFRLAGCRRVLGLDLDCEVRGSLQPVVDLIGTRIVLAPDHPIREYGQVFLPEIYFNSGVIGVSGDDPVLPAWELETLRKHEHFRSDQEILNFVLYRGVGEVLELPTRFNSLRLHGPSEDAVIRHWTGPEGKAAIRDMIATRPAATGGGLAAFDQ